VGDINLSDKSYESFKKQNQLFILGMSDSNCERCCQSEPLLKEALEEFKQENYINKKNIIKVARVDI
jgi:hypothetical protein